MKKQLLKFGSVGVIITATDFLVLNALLLLGWSPLLANVLAVTTAMTLSFGLNRTIVFTRGSLTTAKIVRFVAGTMFSLYILQSLIMYVLISVQPVVASGISIVIYANLAKLLATAVSASFNFIYYKKAVFVE